MKKIILVTAMIALLAVIFYIKFDNEKESRESANVSGVASLEKVTIIFSKNTESVTFLYDFLKDNGFYEKQGLEVEYVESIKNGFQTFLSGGSDFFAGGINNASAAYLNGAEPRVIADLGKISNVYLVSKFSRDEAGSIKKAAISGINTSTGLMTKLFLENLGVDFEKVEYLTVKTVSERMAALSSGQVDIAIAQSYNEIRGAVPLDEYHIFNSNILSADLPYDKYLTTTKDVIEKKPESVKKMTLAYLEGMEFIKKNPEDAMRYLEKKYEYSKKESEDLYESFVISQQNLSFIPDAERVSLAVADAKKELELNVDRDVSNLIDSRFASEAMAAFAQN
ncbi:MAG: hypothetical protein ACD_9C00318G0002 [uncultured bacterium]|nr:MAG: hypothetical protein ACD_9C00318G0002 [uncultured bacterium]